MAGGGQNAGAPQGGQPSGSQMTPAQMQAILGRGAVTQPQGTQTFNTRPMTLPQGQGYADGGMVNPSFMQYQGQGQPNQPPMLSGQAPAVQNDGGPDVSGGYAGSSMGFDGSGSDAGVGGQPVNQMQSPLQSPTQQGNKPLGLTQFQQPQGLQIAGNPTSQIVQRPQIR